MVRAAAAGVGNAVVLMGASTGRDGIGGASVLASAELGEGDDAKRPTVQIGDPFEESKVLECCLELLGRRGCWSRCRTSAPPGSPPRPAEMASAGGVGIDIDVARVPLREADMEPFEIMVSESQERMLGGGRAGAGSPRCWRSARSGRPASAEIGVVTDSGQIRVLRGGEVGRRDAGRGAGRRLPALRPRARPSRRAGSTATGRRSTARRLGRGDAAGAARLAQHRLQALGLRAVRLGGRLAHRAPARVRRRRGPRRSPRPATRSRSRSTATGAGSPATPTPARSRRCSSAPRTSPASAPSRSA